MIGLITRSLCSATAASRADERAYQVASSVRTSSSTLLSTRISGTSASAAPRQGQDLVGAQTGRRLAAHPLDELPPACTVCRHLAQHDHAAAHLEGDFRVR